jgi:DNA ligase (NAD+)
MIDGLVICPVDWKGENTYYPTLARAFKLNCEQVPSTVRGIEWKVGKTGKVNPIVLIDPIELNGTTVKRVSGYNFGYLESWNLGVNTRVIVQKSGDIIPCIVESELDSGEDVKVLTNCPECSSPLTNKNGVLYCRNIECPGIVYSSMESFLFNLGVDNVTKTSLKNWGISTFQELFEFKPNGKSQESLVEQLHAKVFNKSDKELYIAAPWKGYAGRKIIRKILDVVPVPEFEEWVKYRPILEDLDFDGIGEITVDHIIDELDRVKPLIDLVKEYRTEVVEEEEVQVGNSLGSKSFLVTGSFDVSRKDIVRLIEDNGGQIKKSLSKNIDYVVLGEKPGPSKVVKIKDLNLTTISFDELQSMIKA